MAASSAKVRVCSRFRPLNAVERECDSRLVTQYDDGAHPGSVGIIEEEGNQANMFHFDHVFPTTSSQQAVYEYCGKHLVKEALNGFNCTIFAYGQTGSGKTFTMMGPTTTASGLRREQDASQRGLIPRIIEEIFASISEADEELEFTVKVSYAEIYMEKLRDLIDPSHLGTDFGGEKKKALRIRQDKLRGVYIEGITELYTSNPTEVLEIMMRGNVHRAIASTRMNQDSSRSHSVFTVTITNRNVRTTVSKESKLVLIDLAGSEMVKKTAASGQTMKEAQTINKSLSALGNVIMALTMRKKHIPYRDSVLTRLLSDSLGGNSKTSLIITVSPAAYVRSLQSLVSRALRACCARRPRPLRPPRRRPNARATAPMLWSASTAWKKKKTKKNIEQRRKQKRGRKPSSDGAEVVSRRPRRPRLRVSVVVPTCSLRCLRFLTTPVCSSPPPPPPPRRMRAATT